MSPDQDPKIQIPSAREVAELEHAMRRQMDALGGAATSLSGAPDIEAMRRALEAMGSFAALQVEALSMVRGISEAVESGIIPRIEGEPLNLLLVRHGRSVGNERDAIRELADDDPRKVEFLATPDYQVRLISRGRKQAESAGTWLRDNLDFKIDAAYCPDFARSQETAGIIGVQMGLETKWRENDLYGERAWGPFNRKEDGAREAGYEERLRDANHWAPEGGASMAEVKLGVRLALGTLHRKHNMDNVLISSHGERITGFRQVIERFSTEMLSKMLDDGPPNCGIVHYTRKNPETGEVAGHFGWVRLVCPYNLNKERAGEKWDGNWRPITRPEFSSQELLDRVKRLPQIFDP